MVSKHIEVSGTEVMGVKSPTLEHLMSNKCTKAELQAALVQLIQIVNMNQVIFKEWSDKIDRKLGM